MTLAKVQPFCKIYGLNIRVHSLNSKKFLPHIVKEKNICLYLSKNRFCVIWNLDRRTSSLGGVKEIERRWIRRDSEKRCFIKTSG